MIEPTTTPLPQNVMVARTIVQTGRCSNVRIANFSTGDVWLKPRTRVGMFHSLNGIVEKDQVLFQHVSVSEMKVSLCSENVVSPNLDERPIPVDFSKFDCSSEEKEKAFGLFARFPDIFAADDHDFGCTDAAKHRIFLKNDLPVSQAYRRIPPNRSKRSHHKIARQRHHSQKPQCLCCTYCLG